MTGSFSPPGDGFVLLVAPDRLAEAGTAPSGWFLSDSGRATVRNLALLALWEPVQRLYTGPDVAQHETAQIVASLNGISVTIMEELAAGSPLQVVQARLQMLAIHDGGLGGAVIERFVAERLLVDTVSRAGETPMPVAPWLLVFDPGSGRARPLDLEQLFKISLARTPGLGDE